MSCIKLKQFSEAVKAAENAVKHSGKDAAHHVLYMSALAYRENRQYEKAMAAYKQIMKDKDSIFDFLRMIIKINKEIKMSKIMEDPASIEWRVDLYASFFYNELLPEYKPSHSIDLWQYYTEFDGWHLDKSPLVIDLLRRIRFFNRFDSEALRNLLTHVTLRKVPKQTLLFLHPKEAAIVVSG